jgi:hypothetical protein
MCYYNAHKTASLYKKLSYQMEVSNMKVNKMAVLIMKFIRFISYYSTNS